MAVNILYVVTKNGEEVMRTEDKKYADWYDKRLDCADEIATLLQITDNKVFSNLTDDQKDELCVGLAMHGNKISKIMKGKVAQETVDSDGLDEYHKN